MADQMKVGEPAPPDTLIVRRLPDGLTERDLNELFCSYFGAVQARKEGHRHERKPAVLVRFKCHEDASYALSRLHQLVVKGKRISVEFADFTFLPKPQSESITHLKPDKRWKFPPANSVTVKNISQTLLTDQEFYHKVLELMHSMGLPPPFDRVAEEERCDLIQSEIEDVEMEELYKEDTEESELEQDEDLSLKEVYPKFPSKRKKTLKVKRPIKIQALRPSYTKLKSSTEVPLDEVFDKTDVCSGKKLVVRIPSDILQENETVSDDRAEGFGKFEPAKPVAEKDVEKTSETVADEESLDFISRSKLAANRITQEEMKLLPVFKNYSSGEPNSRLYIKNLAKVTKEEDLKFIYGRYVVWMSEEEQNMFDIRLMTEGRMKGQAFVTLPNVKRAEQALSETNGYVLNGKPLVVQFARSAQAKSTKE